MMLKALEKRLVDRWWLFYKRISVWLAALYSTISVVIATNQNVYFALADRIPQGRFHAIAIGGLWLLLGLPPVLAVLIKQKSVSGNAK